MQEWGEKKRLLSEKEKGNERKRKQKFHERVLEQKQINKKVCEGRQEANKGQKKNIEDREGQQRAG